MHSFTTHVEALSSDKEMIRECWNDVEFMCDGAKPRKDFSAAQNFKPAQPLVDVKKYVLTIRRALLEYRLKLFSETELGSQEFCCRVLVSDRENALSRQEGK